MFPDQRYSGALGSAESFKTIVLDGALKQNGMVSFAQALSTDDAEAVRAYLVSRAIEVKATAAPVPPAAPPPPAQPHGG
jgi:quinohemoprotein ethanol dehydrogenase